MKPKTLLNCCIATLVVVWPSLLDAEILSVPDNYPTVTDALAAAVNGDIIDIEAGTYVMDQMVDLMGKSVSIQGAVNEDGSPATIFVASSLMTMFKCDTNESPATSFRNLQMEVEGVGIYTYDTSPTITNCVFTKSTDASEAASAVGMSIEGRSNAEVLDCTFRDLRSETNGGGLNVISDYSDSGHVRVQNCLFENNVGQAGALYVLSETSAITVVDCVFDGNTAERGGGLNLFLCNDFSVIRSTFTNNHASVRGGGINIEVCSGNVVDCTINNNTAGLNGGGGFYIFDSFSTPISQTTICGNHPDQWESSSCPSNGCWFNAGGNTISTHCADWCPADYNRDGIVNGTDLSLLLGHWGLNRPEYDINDDGTINGADLSFLLGAWGLCS